MLKKSNMLIVIVFMIFSFISISATAQTVVELNERVSREVIKDIEAGDTYKELYEVSNKRVELLDSVNRINEKIISNNLIQLKYQTEISDTYKNSSDFYKTQYNNLTIKQSKQDIVIKGGLILLLIISLFK